MNLHMEKNDDYHIFNHYKDYTRRYLVRFHRRVGPPVRRDSLELGPEGDAGREEVARLSLRPTGTLLPAAALVKTICQVSFRERLLIGVK